MDRKNIRIDKDSLALQIAQTPVGAMRSHITTPRSRDILFVDAARSLSIEARKDAVTSKVQYRSGNDWIDIRFDNTDIKKQSKKEDSSCHIHQRNILKILYTTATSLSAK